MYSRQYTHPGKCTVTNTQGSVQLPIRRKVYSHQYTRKCTVANTQGSVQSPIHRKCCSNAKLTQETTTWRYGELPHNPYYFTQDTPVLKTLNTAGPKGSPITGVSSAPLSYVTENPMTNLRNKKFCSSVYIWNQVLWLLLDENPRKRSCSILCISVFLIIGRIS